MKLGVAVKCINDHVWDKQAVIYCRQQKLEESPDEYLI